MIDIIIPTYNGVHHLVRLLDSILNQNYKDYHCFVIDDNSQDNTVEIVREKYPWVHLIEQKKNYGPAENRNIDIRKGQAPYIAIFDNDVILKDRDWLGKALRIMDEESHIGQVASMILSGFEKDILLDCGIMGEGPFFGGGYFFKKHVNSVFRKHEIRRRVLGACTAGTILRRDVFEKVGGFDPKYYYLCEDLDLSLRIHLLGYDVIYDPSLVIYHYESQAMGRRLKLKKYLFVRNCFLVLSENYPFKYVLKKLTGAFRECIALIYANIVYIFKGTSGENNSRAKLVNYFRAFLFLFLYIPKIAIKRRQVNKFRTKSRKYLIEIGKKVTSELYPGSKVSIRNLIFSVTNKCNAKCKMCFHYKELNKRTELLSLREIEKMLSFFRGLNMVVLGGGEPFIREDIEQICRILVSMTNPGITIPTNGSLPSLIYNKTKVILESGCKRLCISLSLDGMAKYHDANRGVEGLFRKVKQTYDKLQQLKALYQDRLELQVNTCVTRENLEQIDSLSRYIIENMPEANWVFEPVRGAFNKELTDSLSVDDWKVLYKKSSCFNYNNLFLNSGTVQQLYSLAVETLNRETQVTPCYGGEEFISIDYYGNIAPCEMLKPVVNLREIDYDINRLAENIEWNKQVNRIRDKKCFCTHFCWLGYSLNKKNTIESLFDRDHGNDAGELYQAASFHKRSGEFIKAEELFNKVLKSSSDNKLLSGAKFHLGEIELIRGNKDKAKDYFKETLKTNPNHQKASQLLTCF